MVGPARSSNVAALRNDRGAVLALTAMVMMLMLMISAFATDVGAWYLQGQQQQRTADLASLNGVQALHQERRAFLDSHGASDWSSLSAGQQVDGERLAFTKSLEAVEAMLRNQNLDGFTLPDMSLLIPDPGPPPLEYSATLVATNGTQAIVTKTPAGNITVQIIHIADQYFSEMLGDAPTINRVGTAKMSNCGAECSITIGLTPPASGFEADGAGDGWAPLAYGNDEVWAINHHVDDDKKGKIVCMKRATGTPCVSTSHFSLVTPSDGLMQTSQQSVDHLDEGRGKIYFTALTNNSYVNPATGTLEADWSGIACFDIVTRSWCSNEFTPLFPDNGRDGNQKVNSTGPWAWTDSSGNDFLFVMGQNGELKCVDPGTLNVCGTWATLASARPDMPALDDNAEIISARIFGSEAIFTHFIDGHGTVLQCFDLQSKSSCWGGTVLDTTMDDSKNQATFISYNTAQSPQSLCIASPYTHRCFTLGDGVALGANLPNFASMTSGYAGSFSSAHEWQGRRVFFSNRDEDRTFCYDFENANSCGSIDQHALLPPALAGRSTEPYAYGDLDAQCIGGLGHNKLFFSFDPLSLGNCTTTEVWVTIPPCDCTDGSSGSRYGTLFVPQELLDLVTSLEATVLHDDGSALYIDEDVLALGGVLDLSDADPTSSFLQLKLVVDAKVDNAGALLWTAPISADLTVVVKPTLIG